MQVRSEYYYRHWANPVLLFRGVFVSLVFFLLGISLVFWGVSDHFPEFFRVRKVRKFLGVSRLSLVFLKRPRKRRTGNEVVRKWGPTQMGSDGFSQI